MTAGVYEAAEAQQQSRRTRFIPKGYPETMVFPGRPTTLRRLLYLGTLAIGLFAGSVPLLAQDEQTTACERFGESASVFIGLAGNPVWRTFEVAPNTYAGPDFWMSLTVDRAYRGVNTVEVFLPFPGAAGFDPGRRYLVYGWIENRWGVSFFAPTFSIPVEDAARDLAFLDAVSSSPLGCTVYGSLTLAQIDGMNTGKPLSGVTIRALSNHSIVQTVTDGEGRFLMTGVEAGKVRIEAVLPDELVARSIDDVREGGCARFPLVARVNGRVRGRVRYEDGSPVRSFVDLLPLEEREPLATIQRRSVLPSEDGEYEFEGVSPGRYLLVVKCPSGHCPGSAYYPGSTYYPGTLRREDAVPIVVGSATIMDGLDFTVRGATSAATSGMDR